MSCNDSNSCWLGGSGGATNSTVGGDHGCYEKEDCAAACTVQLSGLLESITADDQIIFCWSFVIDNKTESALSQNELTLNIRAFESDQPFSFSPGLFGLLPPLGPTYTLDASDNIVDGQLVPTYLGNGVFFTAKKFPPGCSAVTLCATFTPISPEITKTKLLPSLFSVQSIMQNTLCGGSFVVSNCIYVQTSPLICQFDSGTTDSDVLCDDDRTKVVVCQDGVPVVLPLAEAVALIVAKLP